MQAMLRGGFPFRQFILINYVYIQSILYLKDTRIALTSLFWLPSNDLNDLD